jgi:hypothetical protein
MKSEQITQGRQVKTTAGWTQGINSVRNPWALPENQVKWAVNSQFRGGIAQTRPGQSMRLSLPPGNFQGGILFIANKQFKAADATTLNQIYDTNGEGVEADELPYMVFAVNGKVYWSPFPLTQPQNWKPFQLTNVSLDPNVSQFCFTLATKSANISTGGDVSVTPSFQLDFGWRILETDYGSQTKTLCLRLILATLQAGKNAQQDQGVETSRLLDL